MVIIMILNVHLGWFNVFKFIKRLCMHHVLWNFIFYFISLFILALIILSKLVFFYY